MFKNECDRNKYMRDYMRRYRERNGEKINIQNAERRMWKRLAEADDRRGRASAALDALLDGLPESSVQTLYHTVAQCTPLMLEELANRAKVAPS